MWPVPVKTGLIIVDFGSYGNEWYASIIGQQKEIALLWQWNNNVIVSIAMAETAWSRLLIRKHGWHQACDVLGESPVKSLSCDGTIQNVILVFMASRVGGWAQMGKSCLLVKVYSSDRVKPLSLLRELKKLSTQVLLIHLKELYHLSSWPSDFWRECADIFQVLCKFIPVSSAIWRLSICLFIAATSSTLYEVLRLAFNSLYHSLACWDLDTIYFFWALSLSVFSVDPVWYAGGVSLANHFFFYCCLDGRVTFCDVNWLC